MSHDERHDRPQELPHGPAQQGTGPTDGPAHTAIIMDGNGRWAVRRGLPRTVGHREGAKAVDAVVQAAALRENGIRCLTLYAFSSDNWRRPGGEVRALMRLFGEYLRRERRRMAENGIRLEVVGRRDRLSPTLVAAVEEAESATAAGDHLTLRLAVDYSARDAIVRAAAMAATAAKAAKAGERRPLPSHRASHPSAEPPSGPALGRRSFSQLLARGAGSRFARPAPDVDLLIRTAGEQRLSDFLLWEAAYAELYFTPVLWPDFGAAELAAAVAEYRRRERRFGGLLEEVV